MESDHSWLKWVAGIGVPAGSGLVLIFRQFLIGSIVFALGLVAGIAVLFQYGQGGLDRRAQTRAAATHARREKEGQEAQRESWAVRAEELAASIREVAARYVAPALIDLASAPNRPNARNINLHNVNEAFRPIREDYARRLGPFVEGLFWDLGFAYPGLVGIPRNLQREAQKSLEGMEHLAAYLDETAAKVRAAGE